MKLYARSNHEGGDAEAIPADLVHHFLLAVLTRPGTGLCFKDRGWYPRDIEGDEGAGRIKGVAKGQTKVFNKIISNILKNLRVGEDPRQQELVLKVLVACPELTSRQVAYLPLSQPRITLSSVSGHQLDWHSSLAFHPNGSSILHFPELSSLCRFRRTVSDYWAHKITTQHLRLCPQLSTVYSPERGEKYTSPRACNRSPLWFNIPPLCALQGFSRSLRGCSKPSKGWKQHSLRTLVLGSGTYASTN